MEKETSKKKFTPFKGLSPIKKSEFPTNESLTSNKFLLKNGGKRLKNEKNLNEINTKNRDKENNENHRSSMKLEENKENETSKGKKGVETDKNIHYPKNINEYRHIIDTFHVVDGELGWILDLRTYGERLKYTGLKGKNSTQPKFFDADFTKYREKVEKECSDKRKDLRTPTGNCISFRHLVKERLGATANSSQFAFETTLRNFRPVSKVVKHKTEWQQVPYYQKPRIFSSYLPPMRPDSLANMKKMKDSVIRPYDTFHEVFIFVKYFRVLA
jgi:hypothetical protein